MPSAFEPMMYISTRWSGAGEASFRGRFCLPGLRPDGGLYMPRVVGPRLDAPFPLPHRRIIPPQRAYVYGRHTRPGIRGHADLFTLVSEAIRGPLITLRPRPLKQNRRRPFSP